MNQYPSALDVVAERRSGDAVLAAERMPACWSGGLPLLRLLGAPDGLVGG